jgi:hypothetical protein
MTEEGNTKEPCLMPTRTPYRIRRHFALLAVGGVAGLAIFVGASPGVPATSAGTHSAETLNLQARLDLVSQLGSCPPGVGAPVTACAARTGEGLVSGLGRVTESYTFLLSEGPPTCAGAGSGKALAYPVRLVVVGKGEIDVAVAEAAECIGTEAVRTQTQGFVITGGTGIYAGASDSGTVERVLGGETPTGRRGTETWTGTLDVPRLEFDVTPPTLSGAVNKTVRAPRRAKSVRVRFTVTAQDARDGSVPVRCTPRSGSRFKLGKTRVTCAATDKSGNTATAKFIVTVRARR